jgi:hypothetical protein
MQQQHQPHPQVNLNTVQVFRTNTGKDQLWCALQAMAQTT